MELELNQREEKKKSILIISTLYNVDDSNDVNLSDPMKVNIAKSAPCLGSLGKSIAMKLSSVPPSCNFESAVLCSI